MTLLGYLKNLTKGSPKSEESTTLHLFDDKENGIQSRVFLSPRGGSHPYGVTLLDVDSGETFPSVNFFKDEDLAIQYAKKIVNIV